MPSAPASIVVRELARPAVRFWCSHATASLFFRAHLTTAVHRPLRPTARAGDWCSPRSAERRGHAERRAVLADFSRAPGRRGSRDGICIAFEHRRSRGCRLVHRAGRRVATRSAGRTRRVSAVWWRTSRMAEPYLGMVIRSSTTSRRAATRSATGQLMSIAQNTALFSLLGDEVRRGRRDDVRAAGPARPGGESAGSGPGLANLDARRGGGDENDDIDDHADAAAYARRHSQPAGATARDHAQAPAGARRTPCRRSKLPG